MTSPPLPSLESLRVLAVCVRCRNFSRAAEELHLSPSAVSLRIRTLEAELGVTLFERHGPKLSPTERAAQLAAAVDGALHSIQATLHEANSPKRQLRVTAAPTFAARWLIPRLAAYQAQPDALPIALDASDAVWAGDRFDVAIRSGDGGWSGLSSLELLPDTGMPMLSPKLLGDERPITARRLLDVPLLPDGRWRAWLDAAGLPDARPTFCPTRFATYELEAVAAVQGVGVALLSPLFYGDLVATGALVAPFETMVHGPKRYWALWRADEPAPGFVRWLERELLSATRGAA